MKLFWFDLETTGLNPDKHGLIQIGCLIDQDGKMIDNFEIKIKPFKTDLLTKGAFEKTGVTVKQLKTFNEPLTALRKFEKFMEVHIDKYDKTDKFIMAGKNIQMFDIPFLRKFYDKCDNLYFGSWFYNMYIDINTNIAEAMVFNGLRLQNYQLGTLCEAFDIDLNAHDAMSDIIATRQLYYKIKGIDI